MFRTLPSTATVKPTDRQIVQSSLTIAALLVCVFALPLEPRRAIAQEAQAFQPIEFCQESIERTNECSRIASRNKVVVQFWGGDEAMRREAVAAVAALNAEGYRTALIYGPDLDDYDGTVQISYMALEQDPFSRSFTMGRDHTLEIGAEIRQAAIRVFLAAFPDAKPASQLAD